MQEEYKKLTISTERLISIYDKKAPEEDKEGPKIQVDQIVSKFSFLYEKIRNVIDYKEDHLLRKSAIKRILIRRLTWKSNAKSIAAPLIYELIRGSYLENNKIPESRVDKVSDIVKKYIYLLNLINEKNIAEKEKKKIFDWILGIAACEIEEVFESHYKDEAMAEYMYQVMNESIRWPGKLSQEEKSIQIYIAIQRALLKSDREIIAYRILDLYYPKWFNGISFELIKDFATNIDFLHQNIEDQIDHPLSGNLIRIVKKHMPSFLILGDVLEQNRENIHEVLSRTDLLEEAIKDACDKRYKETKVRLRRSSIRSIIYIFVTKIALALAIEVPYDLYIADEVSYIPLIINIMFFPVLLFLIALTIKVPADENTRKITDILKGIIYQGEEKPIAEKVRASVGRNIFLNAIFYFVYSITFIISFGILITVLIKMGFNAVAIGFFLLFLSLVSFFGIRNRESVRELIVVDERKKLLTSIVDFFAIPILRVGRWISLNFSRINFMVFIFDFIIEAPFKAFIEITEDFSSFLRDKKEEITMK